MKGSKNNVKMSNNQMVVCGLVVVLILVGLYFLLQGNNVLGNNVQEGFSSTNSKPMELNNLTEAPNPDDNTVVIVLFYVEWCPHCVSTKPVWEEAVKKHNNTTINGKNVKVQACNCEGSEVEQSVARDNNIQGYPTIKAITQNGVEEHNGSRSLEDIETFINHQCGN